MTVYGDEAEAFLRGHGFVFDNAQAMGWRGRDGRIEAAAVFYEWHPERGTVEMSVAGRRAWISRSRVAEMFDYPFSFASLVYGRTYSPTLLRAWGLLGGDATPVPGLWTVVTLSRAQWGAWKEANGKR